LGEGEGFEDFTGKTVLTKLLSFNFDLPLCISGDNTHHTMIVTILILDCTSLFNSTASYPFQDALDNAHSQYVSSGTHDAVKEQFSLPPKEYSILQFTEFILSHRLQ